MVSLGTVLITIFAYLALLVAVAQWAEKRRGKSERPLTKAIRYSLSLAIFHSTWTFYGTVGFAVQSGFLFLAIYLGPTIAMLFSGSLLRKMIRLKEQRNLTSIADLIATRYGKSQLIGAVATLLAIFGTAPYIALQLKSIVNTLLIVTGYPGSEAYGGIGNHFGTVLTFFMLVFTILFGLRRITPTERHPGVVNAVAFESLVKLCAFAAAGIFVSYFLFNGISDILSRAALAPHAFSVQSVTASISTGIGGSTGISPPGIAQWLAVLLLGFSGFMFLPRQFHVAVVENSDEDHLRTAMWLVPLYMLAITFFVVPIAAAGLSLGLSPKDADSFVLSIPALYGHHWLSMLVFIGGLSAGTSMVIVATMTIAVMMGNHLLLPIFSAYPALHPLRRHLLGCRWLSAAILLTLAYGYERIFGPSHDLSNIGLISFAAFLQFAPTTIGGLYFRKVNRQGALAALSVGSFVWFYTLVLPEFSSVHWVHALLERGPFGIAMLRPQAILGVTGFDPLTHSVFVSLTLNICALILGTLLFRQSQEEQLVANEFVDALVSRTRLAKGQNASGPVALDLKRVRIIRLFSEFFEPIQARLLTDQAIRDAGLESLKQISIVQMADLQHEVERRLAASIGTAAAHSAIRKEGLITPGESRSLSSAYGEVLAGLQISPAELKQRIDYYQEREGFLEREAQMSRTLANSQSLYESLDLSSTLQKVAQFTVPQIADGCLVVLELKAYPMILEQDSDFDTYRAAFEFRPGERAPKPDLRNVGGYPTLENVLENPQPVLRIEDRAEDWPGFLSAGIYVRSSLTLPLISRANRLGALTLISETTRHFDQQRLELCQELAHRSAAALDNALLYVSANRAIRDREDFLSIASHELRTPLSSLKNQVQLLLKISETQKLSDYPPDKLQFLLTGADRQVDRLNRLIQELLNVTRARQGKLELSPEDVDLALLTRGILERYRFEIGSSGCEIQAQLDPGVLGSWDRLKIEEVILNLLNNAMKYAPGKPIELRVWASSIREASFSIRDHGPGIPAQDQAKIFQRFQRATADRKVAGFGLGLYIARQIVEAHGGAIRVESEPGAGATFVMTLPKYP